MLIKRAQDHVLGNVPMSATQVRCLEILLRKVAPDLQMVSGEVTHRHQMMIREITITPISAQQTAGPAVIDARVDTVVVEPEACT